MFIGLDIGLIITIERGHLNIPRHKTKVSACCLNPWVRPASSGKYGLIELSPLSALMGPSKLVVPALSEDIPVRWYKEEFRSTTSEMKLEALLAIGR